MNVASNVGRDRREWDGDATVAEDLGWPTGPRQLSLA